MNSAYEQYGILVVPDILTLDQVIAFRTTLDIYLNDFNSYKECNISRIIPDFAGNTPQLGALNSLHQNELVNEILKNQIFPNKNFIYANHSDLHQNKTTGWHRDTYDYLLEDRGNGNPKDLWSEECHIIKVCFLLQDHINNDYGLWFQPGTHKSEIQSTPIHIKTKSTDMIIFNQRILHSGQTKSPKYHEVFNENRYLITYAYGLDNKHTKIHTLGATKRQSKQKV